VQQSGKVRRQDAGCSRSVSQDLAPSDQEKVLEILSDLSRTRHSPSRLKALCDTDFWVVYLHSALASSAYFITKNSSFPTRGMIDGQGMYHPRLCIPVCQEKDFLLTDVPHDSYDTPQWFNEYFVFSVI
jgi:hypothetical protein